jgi:polyhydroxyalkanoate synthesis regulator phasin
MRLLGSAILAAFLLIGTGSAAFAQETNERVIDEVVAVVNEGVITLSRVKRETKSIVDSEVQQGKKREEVEKMIGDKQGELIANLINEELLQQKAKELGLDSDIDASINARFLEIMKQYNLKSLDALYKQMEDTGVNPTEIRELWRKQATRERVLQREVQSKVYWRPTGKEVKEYYEKNKARFTKPESITISEIFLAFAGRDEAAVRAKAKDLVTKLRGGADWAKLVVENSDRPDVAKSLGKVDTLPLKDIDTKFAEPLKNVKTGGYSDPIEVDQIGMSILRVDERSAASNESQFDENQVRLAMLQENVPGEQKKFLAELRKDSYIKISDAYRPLVAPILFADERKDKPTDK